MRENKSSIVSFLKSASKIFFLLLCVLLFFLHLWKENTLDWKIQKPSLVHATTIFSGKNIEIYADNKKDFESHISSDTITFLYKKNRYRTLLFEGNTNTTWKEKDSSYRCLSEKVSLFWDLTGKIKKMEEENFKKVHFKENVKIFAEKSLLKTQEAFYLPKEKLFLGHEPSQFSTELGYLESKHGFRWDVTQEILLIDRGFDGISYEK